jgi:hypothetical protein
MPVSEDLYNRKLHEIEHVYKVGFTRQQKAFWFARIQTWEEEVFVLACEKLVNTVEQRWQIRDGNILAMLGNLSKVEAKVYRERQKAQEFQHMMAEAEREAEPIPVTMKEALRKMFGKLGIW